MKRKLKPTPLIKRIFDLTFSFIVVFLLSPVFILISIALLLTHGFPILFTQTRPGKTGKPFKLYKFRSMKEIRNPEGGLLPDENRITRFGNFLRKSSFDEIPELINVIKGDMSIVGPRPLLMQYLERYSNKQARRNDMLPGITGWAQINGRNTISWEEKFDLDVWYVDHWTFWLDIRIILLTVWKVIKREGVSQPGRATMEEFMGTFDKEIIE